MQNELSLYVEPENVSEETSTLEMQLFAELSGYKQTQEQIDKPADKRLVKDVRKATAEIETPVVPVIAPVVASHPTPPATACRRTYKYGFTFTDFILLIIAVLLFFNIITK